MFTTLPVRALAVSVGLALLGLAPIVSAPALAQTSPGAPLPARWPTTLQMGAGSAPGEAAAMRSVAPYGFRYQYLAGGVNTGNNWATWNANGDFARYYINDSVNNGIVPVFTYYTIYQSLPGGPTESAAVRNNLQTRATMQAYFSDLKLFFQKAGAYPNNLVVLHVEPDMWGYIEQQTVNNDATTFPVNVGSSGVSELVGLPDNAAGLAQGIKKLRDLYAPNVVLGYHVSIWGTGTDIQYSQTSDATTDSLATKAANFYRSLNADWDISFAEFSDRDAAFKQIQYGDGGRSWFDVDDFRRHARFLSMFSQVASERVVLWQIPLGNTLMRAENNTWGHYQDNRVEWLLDDATRANLQTYISAGVVAFLFGGGASGTTCACDATNDGVTNPSAINGNDRLSLSSDDDGGFFKDRARGYYATGALALSGAPSPTPTASPTASPTPSATPSPTPSPTPSATPSPTPSPAPPPTDTTPPAAPAIAAPATNLSTSATTYAITGSAENSSLVRVWVDANANGRRDAGESLAGGVQLTSGGTAYAVSVSLKRNAPNRFVVTATDAAGNESIATAAKIITQSRK